MASVTCPNCSSEVPAGFKFCGGCGHKLDEAPSAAVAPAPVTPQSEPTPVHRDERREVTVLFADVSGFTAMSERLDPEEVHQIMNDCFTGLGRAIQEEDGHIDKYIGDNVMALFGAPVAHEDDPMRAARAALAMQAFLPRFAKRYQPRTGVEFRMRIGIHCGLVLAGGVGSEVRRDYSVMGDTVNLASRLESAASPGSILVSGEIMKRIRGQFELGPAQSLKVKGKEEAVDAYVLLREALEHGRRDPDDLRAPIVGRDAELDDLVDRWRSARGNGERWIEVRGPMGVGKTRLVEEAAAMIEGMDLLWVVARPPTKRRPFALVRRVLHAMTRELTGQASLAKTREEFSQALAPLREGLEPFVNALWYLAAPDRLSVPAPDPDPQTLRRTLERGIAKLLANLAARSPNLALILDSYGLGDDASAALFESMAGGPGGCSVPIIVTARDDERPPYRPDSVIEVGPLSDDAAEELLDRLVRASVVPESLKRDLLTRAAGVPLYLEEMVRTLVDKGVLTPNDAGPGWRCDPTATSAILPASIRGAMVSRIDRLERPSRDLLCQCSVQGIEFDLEVTERVWLARDSQGPPVSEQLRDLEHRELVTRLGGSTLWAFRQPLLQDTCYETLLLRDRRALHGETAEAMCGVAGGADAISPELLAHHYEHAEMWEPAAEANLRAGDRAAELFLNEDAVRRYERVVGVIGRIDAPSEASLRTAVLAYGGAAKVHLRVGAYGLAEEQGGKMRSLTGHSGDRAEADRLVAAAWTHTGRTEEAERLLLRTAVIARESGAAGDVVGLVLHDLAELFHRAGRTQKARERLAECRAVDPADDPVASIRLDMLEGRIAHTEGRFAEAVALYERAYEAAERLGSLSEQARTSNSMGNAARDVGDYDAAEEHFQQALAVWERTGDTECIAGAHNNLANLALSRGDLELARTHHERSLTACREIGNVHGSALAQTNLAILAIEGGDGPTAVAQAAVALETLGGSGNAVLRGLTLVVLGEAHLECGKERDAETAFMKVLGDHDDAHHPLAVAGAQRGLGRVAFMRGECAEALERLAAGLAGFERLERAQEAARTRLYRGEVLCQLGEIDRARSDVAQARKRFVEMGADRDVERAEQLMGRLTAAAGAVKS